MTRPAIQLHSVRNHEKSLPDVLRRVHRAGFEGVEFAGRLQHADPAAVADALDDTGLVALGAHPRLSTLETSSAQFLEPFETVGCQRLVVPHLPAVHFRTVKRIEELAARFRAVAADLDSHGFEVLYHNTRYDLSPPLGRPGLDRLVDRGLVPGAIEGRLLEPWRRQRTPERPGETGIGHLATFTDPALGFELDAGEIRAAGFDQQSVFEFFGDRLSLVHVCDVTGPAEGYRSTSPGTGVLDFEAVFAAAERNGVEWLVYEHDHPEDPELTIQRGADAVAAPIRDLERPMVG